MSKAAKDVQSCRKRYWQTYEESEGEYPAEIFPESVDGYGESAQSTGKSNCIVRGRLGVSEHGRAEPARLARCARTACIAQPHLTQSSRRLPSALFSMSDMGIYRQLKAARC